MGESRLDVAFRTSPILRRLLSVGFAEIKKVRSTTPQPADSLNVRAVFPALLQLMEPPSSSGRSFLDRSKAMNRVTKNRTADRSKINMLKDYEVKYWTRELGVSKERLQQLVDKVGNAAAAVRKELAT
jgi:Protein of unknown function (DUF3606)